MELGSLTGSVTHANDVWVIGLVDIYHLSAIQTDDLIIAKTP
jgi:hypothetical protein